MKKTFLSLLLVSSLISMLFMNAYSETGGGTKVDCNILVNEGGNTTLLPSGNTGTVGKDVILGCMGLPGAFTGDDSLTLSGSTGNNSIAQVFPFSNNITVNQDGSTNEVNFSIMILAPGSTDIAVDFFGAMNFDVNSTLWTFQEASSGSGGGMSSSSTSGGTTSTSSGGSSSSSTSSSGGSSSDICSAASASQCKAKISRKECKSCCTSLANGQCIAKCLKGCKKTKKK